MHEALVRQNPWWEAGIAALARDRQLAALEPLPLVWNPPLTSFAVDRDLVLTLRGPRQVGKSTLLKLLVRDLLKRGKSPRHILYLDVPRAGVSRHPGLTGLLDEYLDWISIGRNDERVVILLDEVTGVLNWATSVRGLVDSGRLEGATLLATGSNARDVKAGGDRLPGRRGRAPVLDYLLQPLSFRDYVGLVDPATASALAAVAREEVFDPNRLHALTHDLPLHGAQLRACFARYLTTGGFLSAINEEAARQLITEETYQVYRSAVLGEVVRMRGQESQLRAVVAWLDGRLGDEFDWREMGRETGLASHETVRDFVDKLESAYLWYIFWRVKSVEDCSPALQSPKKLYPADPFMWHMLSAWSRGGAEGWPRTLAMAADDLRCGKLVESIVADHLRRLQGQYAYYYRTRGGEEIDFITCHESAPVGRIEVKYRRTIAARDRMPLSRHGGGVLLTRDSLHWHPADSVLEVPVHYLLALWPAQSLYPTVN